MNSKYCPYKNLGGNVDAWSAGTFESLEPRLLLAATPVFDTDLADFYALNPDGGGLSIGIDGFDADGDALTISVDADDATGLRWEIFDQSTSANRYAVLHFVQSDGMTPIGDIVLGLFESRSPLATDRFITLSTHYFDGEGNPIPADGANDPFYTDVVVHRVIDEFMVQCGDAENGDGTGSSPLGDFDGEFHADLAFTGRGMLAMANNGDPDTNDGQWFITDAITSWLDGAHPIFGQVISGWDIYEQLITTETDGSNRPLDPPILASVDIVASDQDATVTLVADDTFTGPTEVTFTLSDTEGNHAFRTITVTPDPSLAAIDPVDALAGETVSVPLQVTFEADEALTFETAVQYAGDGEVVVGEVTAGAMPGEYELPITLPAEYTGEAFDVGVYVFMGQFDNRFGESMATFSRTGRSLSTRSCRRSARSTTCSPWPARRSRSRWTSPTTARMTWTSRSPPPATPAGS